MTTIPEPDARAAPWWHLPAVSEPPADASLPGDRLADAALVAFAAVLGGITQGYLWHIHGEVLAPGAPVQVRVTADGQAVTAEVLSRRRPMTAVPGAAEPAGARLIGLAERVTLAGGQLEHGRNAIGDFALRATIPRQP